MPKDALTIYRAAEELGFTVGGKIDKVNMPDRDTLILLVHTKSGNRRLLLSCNPSLPRVHITERKYVNPDVASGTLMFFRKRLVGAVITEIKTDKCERMVSFELSARDELLRPVAYTLIAELTGKCANIVFVENGIIGNCLRKVTAEAPGKRAVLIGLKYAPPTATGRVGIFDRERFSSAVAEFSALKAHAAVDKVVSGLSQTTVAELFFRMNADDAPNEKAVIDRFISEAEKLYAAPLAPTVTFDSDGKPLDYFTEPYVTCGGAEVKRYETLNAAMDAYYSALFDAAEIAAYSKPLRAAVKTAVSKNKKRLTEAENKIAEGENADADRILGELITSNIYRINRGDTCVTVENWYDGNKPVTIPLDPSKSPSQNAAVHFKAYNKKKKAVVYALAAKDAALDALDKLDGISAELLLCTERRELDEVRDELVALGLIKPQNRRLKKKDPPSKPLCFTIDGATLLVGKNNSQNDRITRDAAKTDTWLHVKDAHGSHAVLKTPSPTDSQILRAAEIAAFYSQARGADKVAVDYTRIKHVYLRGGGKAEYKEYKTIIVTPTK